MASLVPFYEYRRPDGTILEVMQKMTDPPLTEDPETGVPLERVFHPIAVHFKGKGFYNTDYGTKKRQREHAKSEEGKKAAESQELTARSPSRSPAASPRRASDSSSSSARRRRVVVEVRARAKSSDAGPSKSSRAASSPAAPRAGRSRQP